MAASGRKEGRVESFNCFMHWGCALVCALGLEVITIWIQRGSVSQDCVCLRERDNCCNCPQIITVLPSRTQLKSHFLSGTTWKYSLFLTGANLVSKWSLDNWCFFSSLFRLSWSWPRKGTVCSCRLWLPVRASPPATPPVWEERKADSTSLWSWLMPRQKSDAFDKSCKCCYLTVLKQRNGECTF